MQRSADALRVLLRDFDHAFDGTRLIRLAVKGFTSERVVGRFSSPFAAAEYLLPLLADDEFTDRYLRLIHAEPIPSAIRGAAPPGVRAAPARSTVLATGRRAARRAALSPALALGPFAEVQALDAAVLDVLAAICGDRRDLAALRERRSWAARKAPMARYWRKVAGHAGLVLRALGFPSPVCRPDAAGALPRERRNPVLALPSSARLAELSDRQRHQLAVPLLRLQTQSAALARRTWRRSADAGEYWHVVAVYAGHIRRAARAAAALDQVELLAAA